MLYIAMHARLTCHPDLNDIQKLTTFRSIISYLGALSAKAMGEIRRLSPLAS